MKILLATRSLSSFGGSETWAVCMASTLRELGHDVTVTSRGVNNLLPDFEQLNSTRPVGSFDVGLFNHGSMMQRKELTNLCDVVIQTCHGVIPGEEKPHQRADLHVGVSEEIQAAIETDGFECAAIIRNPIDTHKFASTSELSDTLRTVMYISNNGGGAFLSMLNEAVSCELIPVGRSFGSEHDPSILMNQADLVVSLGRGAYEAMACGRPVIIADIRGGDGYVTASNVFDFRTHNCSGRYTGAEVTAEWLNEQLAKYDPLDGARLRDYVVSEHDRFSAAHRYLSLI